MLVLGLQGSPRKKGNSDYLLSAFMEAAEGLGARTQVVDVCRRHIEPCKELIVCEKKGFCPIDDDMKHEIYGLLREADVIVPASPIFFYNCTAQLKALIDRCQTLWARKYKLKLTDPGRKVRKGYVLSMAATRGKNLFEGLNLTMQYFFDAVGAELRRGADLPRHRGPGGNGRAPDGQGGCPPGGRIGFGPLVSRKKVLFLCRENACRSQMAGAFARHLGGDRLDVSTGGSEPAAEVNPLMLEAMAEKGIDLAFKKPTGHRATPWPSHPGDYRHHGLPRAMPLRSRSLPPGLGPARPGRTAHGIHAHGPGRRERPGSGIFWTG